MRTNHRLCDYFVWQRTNSYVIILSDKESILPSALQKGIEDDEHLTFTMLLIPNNQIQSFTEWRKRAHMNALFWTIPAKKQYPTFYTCIVQKEIDTRTWIPTESSNTFPEDPQMVFRLYHTAGIGIWQYHLGAMWQEKSRLYAQNIKIQELRNSTPSQPEWDFSFSCNSLQHFIHTRHWNHYVTISRRECWSSLHNGSKRLVTNK